jgi:hypothetical protein
MTLANMRGNGVRSLWVVCPLCHHEAVVNVDSFGPDVAVPALGPRIICTGCGIIGADVRPIGKSGRRERASRACSGDEGLALRSAVAARFQLRDRAASPKCAFARASVIILVD